MKNLITYLLGAWAAVNTATLLVFAYRYIWFSIQTVPADRVFFLVVMEVISGFAFGIWLSIKNDI